MKKFFAIIISVLAICLNAYSQQWKTIRVNADELKGNDAYYSNVYKSANGDYFSFSSNQDKITIGTKGYFQTNHQIVFGFHCYLVELTIGFYKDGKLIEKITEDMPGDDEFPETVLIRSKTEKILKHLKTVGDIRIIAKKSRGEFDITIPMNKNLKVSQ